MALGQQYLPGSVRPSLIYACQAWNFINDSKFKKIQTMSYKNIRATLSGQHRDCIKDYVIKIKNYFFPNITAYLNPLVSDIGIYQNTELHRHACLT